MRCARSWRLNATNCIYDEKAAPAAFTSTGYPDPAHVLPIDVIDGTWSYETSVMTIVASSVVVAYREADMTLFPMITTTPNHVRPSPTIPVMTASTALPTATSTPHISTGAKTGIGVGIAIGVCCILALSLIVFRALSKRRAKTHGKAEAFHTELQLWQTLEIQDRARR